MSVPPRRDPSPASPPLHSCRGPRARATRRRWFPRRPHRQAADRRRYGADLLKDRGIRAIDAAERPLIAGSLLLPFLLGPRSARRGTTTTTPFRPRRFTVYAPVRSTSADSSSARSSGSAWRGTSFASVPDGRSAEPPRPGTRDTRIPRCAPSRSCASAGAVYAGPVAWLESHGERRCPGSNSRLGLACRPSQAVHVPSNSRRSR
jgi:hypothetical protein